MLLLSQHLSTYNLTIPWRWMEDPSIQSPDEGASGYTPCVYTGPTLPPLLDVRDFKKIDTSSHDMLLICVRDQNAFSCFQSLNMYLADDQSNDLRSSSISFSILPTFSAISLLWGFRICLTEGYNSSISL